MKGISRRALSCAVVAATGALTLSGTALAQTTFPEKTGDGVPTGQGSIQLFTHSGYISNGGGLGAAPPAMNVANAADGSSCATATSTECRWNRLDALFGYFAANGLDSVELFGHAGLPTNENIDGPYGWKQYRQLLDKHNLHAAGWHGSLNEAQWPARVAAAKVIGLDYIGTGNGQADGYNLNNYDQVLRSAETLNRLGKYSVENGVGPVYVHNHTGEFDDKHVDNGVLEDRVGHPGRAHRPALRRLPGRRLLGDRRVRRHHRHGDRGVHQQVPDARQADARQGRHQRRRGVQPQRRPTSRGGSPRAFGTGEVDYRPILAAGTGKVQYYSQEQDGATLTDMVTSLRNLKGRGPNVVPTVLGLPTTFPSVAAGTAAAANVVPITIKNTGDAPLDDHRHRSSPTAPTRPRRTQVREGERPGDFQVVDAAGCTAGAIAPNATCFVNVGFKPTSTNTSSVARLIVVSNADNATESILLNGQSTGRRDGRRRRQRRHRAQPDAGPAGQLRHVRAGRRPHVRHRHLGRPSSAPPATRRCRSPTRAPPPPASWSTARSRCRSRCRSTRPTPPTRRPRSPR